MGRIKYLGEVRRFFAQTPVVSSRDIRIAVGSPYSHLLVSNLIRRGEIKRIVKGFYSVSDDPVLSVYCFRPAYLGLQEALSVHGLWEQETAVVIVTAQKVKKSLIEVFGNNVLLHRIKPDYMFGYDIVKYGDFNLPVSDMEKTLIDLVYFNELPDKRTLRSLIEGIEPKKLRRYLKPYPKHIKERVLTLFT